jgi:hypothetical protein
MLSKNPSPLSHYLGRSKMYDGSTTRSKIVFIDFAGKYNFIASTFKVPGNNLSKKSLS